MIRACIFDLGGTIVDKYSLSPFRSFNGAFKKNKINIRNALIQRKHILRKYLLMIHIQYIIGFNNIKKELEKKK